MSKVSTTLQYRKILTAIGLLVCIAVGIAACGNDQDRTSAIQRVPPGSIQDCLRKEGASTAESTSDLSFLSEAEADEEVSKVGFAADRAAKIFVRLWTAASIENRPPRWIMWFGQPADSTRTPSEIVEERPEKSYVMYVVNPSDSLRQHVERCLGV